MAAIPRHRVGRFVADTVNAVGPELDNRRRATVLVTMSMAVLAAAPVFTVVFLVAGSPFVAAVVVASGLGPLTSLWLLRQGRLTAAGHAFVGIFLTCLQLANLANGGVFGLGLWWTLMMPVISMAVLGARQSVIWLVSTMVGFLVYGAGQFAGIEVPQDVPEWVQPIVMGFGGAFLAGLIYLFVWQYERTDQRIRASLRAQEQRASAAHAQVRLVLDSVGQGFCLLDHLGTVAPGHSRVLAEWLGDDLVGRPWAEVLARYSDKKGAWFELGWDALQDDLLPLELCIAQLPDALEVGERMLRLGYSRVDPEGPLEIVVTLHDITDQITAEAAEREQRDLAALAQRMAADPAGMVAFLAEIEALLPALGRGEDGVRQLRALHTIKGNAAMFGLAGLARQCHSVEQAVLEERRPVHDDERRSIVEQWQTIVEGLAPILESIDPEAVHITRRAYERHLHGLSEGDLERALRQALSWGLQAVGEPLGRLSDQARHLAVRLGKGDIDVVVEAHGLRVSAEEWAPLWTSLVHVLRNAIDHGLESPEERAACGKQARGQLRLTTELRGDAFVVSIADDGRGIDWDALARKAAGQGLPVANRADVEEALFADGISSRETATETSGRGVGMAAVAAFVEARGGSTRIESEQGQGTMFRFWFPRPEQLAMEETVGRAA